MKKPNSTKSYLFILLVSATIIACSSDDNTNLPEDPRDVFVGDFEMEAFAFDYLNFDSAPEPVSYNAEINQVQFSKDGEMDKNELQVDLNGFIKELFRASDAGFLQEISVQIENPQPATAQISGSDFSIDDFHVPVQISFGSFSATIDCLFNADGQLTEGKLTMDFLLSCDIDGDSIEMTGTAIGNKE
jgi:hypothetical protein